MSKVQLVGYAGDKKQLGAVTGSYGKIEQYGKPPDAVVLLFLEQATGEAFRHSKRADGYFICSLRFSQHPL